MLATGRRFPLVFAAAMASIIGMTWNVCYGVEKASVTIGQRAADFVGSIGVNHHLNWNGTAYDDVQLELRELKYLGVSLVRDAVPAPSRISEYVELADAGIKFDFVTGGTPADITTGLPIEMATLHSLMQAAPGSVRFIEGPNELNGQIVHMRGVPSSDPSAGVAIVQADYKALHSDQLMMSQGVQYINISVTNGISGWQQYVTNLGDLSQYVDYANWHVYYGGNQPLAAITSMYRDALQSAPGRAVMFTESGYVTAIQAVRYGGGVDESTQAKNTLNLLADAYTIGVRKTFLYELMEGIANPSLTDAENTFGLFHSNGTAKPVATAIHNLTTVLYDPEPNAQSFITRTLAYSINDLPATGNSLLLEKSNGTFDLVVWRESPNWDRSTQKAITVRPVSCVVSLGRAYKLVNVYDPVQSVAPIKALFNVSSLTLRLTDHPLIVEVLSQDAPLPKPATDPGAGTGRGIGGHSGRRPLGR